MPESVVDRKRLGKALALDDTKCAPDSALGVPLIAPIRSAAILAAASDDLDQPLADRDLAGLYCPRRVAGGSLDINRETGAAPLKLTEKRTDDLTFSDEEKKLFRREKVQETAARSWAAREIALDYVNSAPKDSEDRAARLSAFGSFLRCSCPHDGTADIVHYEDGGLALAGVWRCGSKWACPSCASRLLYGEAIRLRGLLEKIAAENAARDIEGAGSRLRVLFLTLTAPHRLGDALKAQMKLFSMGFHDLMAARPIKRWKKRLGYLGSVRCFDHTVHVLPGGLDWHSHLHCMLIFDTPEITGDDSPALADFHDALFEKWADIVEVNTGRIASAKAFSLEFVRLDSDLAHDSHALADYAAKICALPGYLTKSAKDKGFDTETAAGLAPFELLDRYAGLGSPEYARAWVEYCQGVKGYKRVNWAPGLAARFGLVKEKQQPVERFLLPPLVAEVATASPLVLDSIKYAIREKDADALAAALAPYDLAPCAKDILAPLEPREAVITDTEAAKHRIAAEIEAGSVRASARAWKEAKADYIAGGLPYYFPAPRPI